MIYNNKNSINIINIIRYIMFQYTAYSDESG